MTLQVNPLAIEARVAPFLLSNNSFVAGLQSCSINSTMLQSMLSTSNKRKVTLRDIVH